MWVEVLILITYIVYFSLNAVYSIFVKVVFPDTRPVLHILVHAFIRIVH